MNGVLGVIPARLASARLPEKPLKMIRGQTLLERVWRRARRAKLLDRVVIATDAESIVNAARSFGAEVVLTSPALACGSERVLAAARGVAEKLLVSCQLAQPTERGEDVWTAVVNIQGDMPFIEPDVIDELVSFLLAHCDRFEMATVAVPIEEPERFLSPHVVKVVVSAAAEALYFSRAPVPCPRDDVHRPQLPDPSRGSVIYGFRHVGLYAFLPAGLRTYEGSTLSPLENVEQLEQLRVLEMGRRIGVLTLSSERLMHSVEVDTPTDLLKAEEIADALDSHDL